MAAKLLPFLADSPAGVSARRGHLGNPGLMWRPCSWHQAWRTSLSLCVVLQTRLNATRAAKSTAISFWFIC